MAAAVSHEGVVAWLREVSLFKSLGDGAVKQVAEQARWRSFPKDTVIIKEGKTGNTMYVLREGEVSVRSRSRYALNTGTAKSDDNDDVGKGTSSVQVDVELATIGEGGYFGELALLSATNLRIADVVAVVDCKCLEINRNTFCEIINPTVKLTATSQERSYEKETEKYQKWRAHKLAEERKRQRHASRSKSMDMPNVVGNQRNKRGGRKGSLASRSSIGRHSLALDELFADDDGKIKAKPKVSRRESTLTDIPEKQSTK